MATVLNNSSSIISVAVSMQKDTNDGHYFQIRPNQQESWGRTGGATAFVLGAPFLTKKVPKVYFIAAEGETIIINNSDL